MGVPPEGLFVLFFTGSSTSGTGRAVSDAASSNVQIVSRRSTIPVAMAPGHDGDMDTLLTVAGLSVAILVSLAIVAAIRALAGSDDPSTDLASFLSPVVGSLRSDPLASPSPVVREDEPVRWNFGPLDRSASAA
jgi:hypothetical protein